MMKVINRIALLSLLVLSCKVEGTDGKKRKAPEPSTPTECVKRVKTYSPVATEQLFKAVEEGNLDLAYKLLKNNDANVNARDSQGLTPLHRAVYRNSGAMAILLINHGADLNVRDSEAQKALENGGYLQDPWWAHLSVSALTPLENGLLLYSRRPEEEREEAFKILKLLIDRGTELNPQNVRFPPLHVAVTVADNEEIINFLIENGANVNLLSSRGITPLGYSIPYINLTNVSALLRQGADVNALAAKVPKTALARLLTMLQLDGVDRATAVTGIYLLLLFGANLNTLSDENKDYMLETIKTSNSPLFQDPIIRALVMGDVDIYRVFEELSKLIDQPINQLQIQEEFLFAVGRQDLQIVAFIVDNFGSNISPKIRNASVIRAAHLDNVEILSYLYQSFKPESSVLDVALQFAARAGTLNTLKFLCKTGVTVAGVQAVSRNAVNWGSLPIITTLFKSGVLTPESINHLFVRAAEQGQLELLDFFYRTSTIAQQNLEAAVLRAALKGHIEIVLRILILHPELNVQQAGKALKDALKNARLSEQQSAQCNEIFTLLQRHQQVRLATLQLESTSRVRQQAEERGIPSEIIEYITGFIR